MYSDFYKIDCHNITEIVLKVELHIHVKTKYESKKQCKTAKHSCG